jgi:metallo-beta-lactamase class B
VFCDRNFDHLGNRHILNDQTNFMNYYSQHLVLLFFFLSPALFAQEIQPVYQSEDLQIIPLSPNTFVHISYLETVDFGRVGSNGMIVINGGEALVFDTPANAHASRELISWLEEKHLQVKGVVATHFHLDCVGGLDEFHGNGIPSYASSKTIELASEAGNPVPQNSFEGKLALQVGDISVISQFPGEGHTTDNLVSYVPADRVLFGGCLIKELGAGVGFLGDSNVSAWPASVSQVKGTFSDVQIVIPGHGKIGNGELLDYTIQLFSGK